MKLVNLFKTATLATAMFCAVGVSNDANAQFGKKLKEKLAKAAAAAEGGGEAAGKVKKAKEAGDPYGEDFTDDTGTSGTYTALDGIEFENAMGAKRRQRTLKLKFTGRDGDKFVNELKVFYNKEGAAYTFNLNDKETKKLGTKVYRYDNFHSIWLVEAEEGVLIGLNNKSTHRYQLDGNETATDVFAKDEAKLEVYDLETAQAKFEQMMSKGKAKEDEKKRAQLMEYEAYKQNVGKVVFVDSYTRFNYKYMDKPSENPDNFISSREMGDDIFLGAYFKEKIGTSCGADCQLNIVYEMNGKKGDRVALRNSSAKWNKMISVKKKTDRFCYNSGHQMISSRENIIDYAFMYTLYQNKATFKEGQTYNMTVTMFSNRDGNNEAEIAKGTVSFKYKAAKMEKWFKQFREWYDE
ncbi:hypothetical protein Fleli_0771 [Bernardetia litoralis DSM 6794]|uniref:DUF4412 domain-containing protein n=1 Tax=Bernardetia litoralis (strain ATCC 23117 / DSM 6794 / NBRC 15988 / NCIMB 1366 / Fx l1 / Sio-4) TaxID=880071 RepID=I4AGZ6_BERLS|nr:hypothetical protein [Bernardetia litoralis]AFM03231.1 hypothetical protein Fleli_0771 [Bernardetia litoralis DSM 6794]